MLISPFSDHGFGVPELSCILTVSTDGFCYHCQVKGPLTKPGPDSGSDQIGLDRNPDRIGSDLSGLVSSLLV